MTKIRSKVCRQCKARFTPDRPLQVVCGPACAMGKVKADRAKAQAARDRQFAAETRRLRESIKTPSQHRRDAQSAFNRYIRARDIDRGCVSCGIRTGQAHAGHYRTRAAAPALSFHCLNVVRQCAQCNNSKSGNVLAFRLGLIARFGIDTVEAIECAPATRKLGIDYLLRLKRIFASRARHLPRLRKKIAASRAATQEKNF